MPVVALVCIAFLSQTRSVGPDQSVKLPNGDKVSILRVTDDLRRRAWTPIGKPIDFPQSEAVAMMTEALGGKNEVQPNPDNTLSIVAQISRPRAGNEPSVAFRLGNSGDVLASEALNDSPSNWTADVTKPFKTATVSVKVGVAEGNWKVVGTYDYLSGHLQHVRGQGFATAVKVVPPSKGPRDFDFAVQVSLPPAISSSAYRVMAYDKTGKAMASAGWESSANGLKLPTSYWFRGSAQTLAMITLETRRYEWASFRDVRLKANH